MINFASVKTKIMIAIFVVLLLAGVIVGYGSYLYTFTNLIDKEEERFALESLHTADKVSDIFYTADSKIADLSSHHNILEYLVNQDDDLIHEVQYDFTHMDKDKIFSDIYLMDEGGNTLVSTNPSFLGKNYSFRPYFKAAIDGNNFIYVAMGVTSGKPGFYISYPVRQEDKVIGVIVGKFAVDKVEEALVNTTDFSQGDPKYKVLDNHGIIIYSSDEDQLYKSLHPLSADILAQIEEECQFFDITDINYHTTIEDLISGISTNLTDNIVSNDNENLELSYFSQIEGTPYYFYVENNFQPVINTAKQASSYLMVLTFITSLFTMIAVNIILKRALSPLSDIVEVANMIAEGDYTAKFKIVSKDEFGLVSKAISRMSHSLLKLNKSKDDLVLKQTKKLESKVYQLEKINKAMIGREIKMLELKEKIQKLKEDKNI